MAYKRADHKRTLPASIWVVLIPGLLFSIASLPFYQRHFLQPASICMEWALVWMLGFAWPLFRDITWKPLSRAASMIAKYSYGIYLTHTYAFYICFVKFKSIPAINVLMSTLITAALSVLAYHLIEEPLITIGKRVATHLGRRVEPASIVLTRVAKENALPFDMKPNKLTRETISKTAQGIDVHQAKDADDLFNQLGN